MKSRNKYFDFLRGISILMVVAIHTMPNISGYNSVLNSISLVLRQVMNCAVPLFLAISGYFVSKKTFNCHSDISRFWRKQIPRVYIPMLVWSIGWFFLSMFQLHNISDAIIKIGMLITGGFSVYYFVALIIQCYMILPLLVKHKWGGVTICIIASFVSISITSYYINIEGRSFPLILYAGPVYLWIVFFMLGIYISKFPDKQYLRYGCIISVVGLILQVIESNYLLDNFGTGIGIKVSSFVFSSGIILSLMSQQAQNTFKMSKSIRIIAWIGEISFGIYLIHTYCIAALNKVINNDNWILMWLFTLLLTLTVVIVMKKIVPASILKKYFGF